MNIDGGVQFNSDKLGLKIILTTHFERAYSHRYRYLSRQELVLDSGNNNLIPCPTPFTHDWRPGDRIVSIAVRESVADTGLRHNSASSA